MSDSPIYTAGIRYLELPKPSDWQMTCCNIIYRPAQGTEPNRFHRFMQELALGFKWRRVEQTGERVG